MRRIIPIDIGAKQVNFKNNTPVPQIGIMAGKRRLAPSCGELL